MSRNGESSVESTDHQRCNRMLHSAVTSNHTISKLIQEIERKGCQIPPNFFVCQPSPEKFATGGFVLPDSKEKEYKPQIVIFENNIIEKESFESTLAHELVHAFDQCRAKVDVKNCLHHACTEIRASNLSGECSWWHDLLRGNTTIMEGKAKCVKRRATLSVSANPYCKDYATAAVDSAFSSCYDDISPLNEDDMWK